MPIDPPVPRDTRSRLADWLEVECLVALRGVSASRFRRFGAAPDESGHETELDQDAHERLETEILEEEPAHWEAEVADEIEWREKVLDRLYPFRLERSLTNWKLVQTTKSPDAAVQAGRLCYLFCLLLSAIRDSLIPEESNLTLSKEAPRDFERIATSASITLVGGDGFHFGWPRDKGTNLRTATVEVSRKLGWKPRSDDPLWSTGNEKDAGIDVIAWRDFEDNRPGRLLLFGQAASGAGWEKKPVELSDFLSLFTEPPFKHYVPALFTPFPQHHKCCGKDDQEFEEVARAEAWKRERTCGLVLDRFRIVPLAAEHMGGNLGKGGSATLGRVEAWVRRAREAAEG